MDYAKYQFPSTPEHKQLEDEWRKIRAELNAAKKSYADLLKTECVWGKVIPTEQKEEILAKAKLDIETTESKFNEIDKTTREIINALDAVFWIDSFEDNDLDDLPDSVLSVIRSKAYEDGHAHGYSEVDCMVNKYGYFAKEIINALKAT
jgi:hypothetical protein